MGNWSGVLLLMLFCHCEKERKKDDAACGLQQQQLRQLQEQQWQQLLESLFRIGGYC